MMEKVAGYGDSERNLRTWRMDLARQWMEEERYEDAREILQPAAENYNVRKLLEEIEERLTKPEAEEAADGRAEEGAEETEEKAAPADPQPAEPEGTEEP